MRKLLLLAVIVGMASAHAASRTYTGAMGNLSFNDPGNWQGGVVPGAGDRAVFGPGSTYSQVYVLSPVTLDGIDFIEGGQTFLLVGTQQVTLTGATPVTATTTTATGFSIQTDVRFTAPGPTIRLDTTAPLGVSPSLDFAVGRLTFSGGTVRVVAPPNAAFSFNGDIGETSPTAFNLATGISTFTGNNSFTGGITASIGALYVQSSDPPLGLSTGPVSLTGTGYLVVDVAPGGVRVINNPMQLSSSGGGSTQSSAFLRQGLSGVVDFRNSINVAGNQLFTGFQGHQVLFDGPITGPGRMTFAEIDNNEATYFHFSNPANTFTGGIEVQARAYVVPDVSNVLPGRGAFHVATNGGLMLGATSQLVESFACDSISDFELDPSLGRLRVANSIQLNGCWLTFTGSVTLPPGEVTLIENLGPSAIGGTFFGFPEGSLTAIGRIISYHGGASGRDAVLLPSTIALAVVSGAPQSLAAGATSDLPYVVRALDPSGIPVPGLTVTFQSAAVCGGMPGQSVDVVTNANGLATAPPYTAGTFLGTCLNTARVGTSTINLPTYQFNPANVTISTTPAAVMIGAGLAFSVQAEVRESSGALLYNAPVDVSIAPGGTAGPSSFSSRVRTDAGTGRASIAVIAGGQSGQYALQIKVGSVTAMVPVTQQAASTTPPMVAKAQDMWWSPIENGWGMSLVQHNDTLFAAMYIYDETGKPTWLVMPGGAWDSTHTIYTGSLYTPSGTPFFAYDASRMVTGNAKGGVTITFQDQNDAILDYTIGGIPGRKLITREIFANGSVVAPDRSDLWWGGIPQNGWGITVLQQASTLFPVWFTYDANGVATWYVMPGGTWTSTDTYEGRVYRTTGAPWVGHDYDPAKLQVFDAGTYRIQFTGDSASFNYTVDGRSGTIPLVREPF